MKTKITFGLVCVAMLCAWLVWSLTRNQTATAESARDEDKTGMEKRAMLDSTVKTALPAKTKQASILEKTNVILPAWGNRPITILAEDWAKANKQQSDKLAAIIKLDEGEKINSEAREREAELRRREARTNRGMTPTEVINILGQPDIIKILTTNGEAETSIHIAHGMAIPPESRVVWSYWPRAGVPFSGKNGQGYQVLYCYFDEVQRLADKVWSQPNVWYHGSIGDRKKQAEYWLGQGKILGPPPENIE